MPAAPVVPFSAAALASALIAGDTALPAGLSATDRVALAWALKDAALACWSTNQAQVASIADVLQQLLALDATTAGSPIRPLHHWVAALAAIAAGRMSDADALLQQAAGLFRTLGLASPAAQTQVPRVLVLCMQGRLDDAQQCGIAALDELIALGDTHAASRVSLNLGTLCCERSDYRAAVKHFEAAAAGFRKANDRQRALQTSIGIGEALAASGEFDAALRRYAVDHDEAVTAGWPVLAALCNERSALIRLARGEFSEALQGFESARQQYERLQMPQHLANTERQLGETYLELRLLHEASVSLQATIARFESLEMWLEAAWTRIEFAKALAYLRADDPRVDAELSAAEQVFAAESQLAGQATAMLARAEHVVQLGKPDGALELATEAAKIFHQLDMAANAARSRVVVAVCEWQHSHPRGARDTFASLLSFAREKGLLSIELCALTHLGHIASHERDYDGARHYFERAVAIVEEQRHRLSGDDLRHAFLSSAVAPYRELLRLALNGAPAPGNASAILFALERYRARALADRLGSVAVRERNSDVQLDELQHRLSWSQRRLRRLQEDGEDADAAEAEVRQLEDEYLELLRRSRLTATENGGLPPATSVDQQSLAALQAALPPTAAIIEYGVVDDELFAGVVDGTSVRIVRRIAPWRDVEGAIRRVQFQMDAMRTSRLLPPQHLRQLEARARHALQQLHTLIWAPLAPTLAQIQRLLVVPHGKLGAISFAALHDGSQYLGEDFEIAVAPSIAVAAHALARRAPVIATPLVLADAQRLRHASLEANALRQAFPQAVVRTNDEASSDSLRRFGPATDCVHLACHGVFRSDNPMFSALELADGNFSAIDAEKLGLADSLVVLSACESGIATETEGDEMFGLVRAFLIGGASRVVASLWPVDDETTVAWMTAFYRSLQSGGTPASASRQAQRAVRDLHPHPFHWAAFATFGGW